MSLVTLQSIPGHDPSYEIVHFASWATYEEGGWMFILRKDGQLYSLDFASSVFSSDSAPEWLPEPISEDRALELIALWDGIEERNAGDPPHI